MCRQILANAVALALPNSTAAALRPQAPDGLESL